MPTFGFFAGASQAIAVRASTAATTSTAELEELDETAAELDEIELEELDETAVELDEIELGLGFVNRSATVRALMKNG